MAAERWRRIPEFTRYEVSDLGRVRHAHSMRVRTGQPGKTGAPWISVCDGKRRHVRPVATLVLRAWAGPRPCSGWAPIHLDGDVANVTRANLAWGPRAARDLSPAQVRAITRQRQALSADVAMGLALALRELVTTINDSAIKLDAATRQTQALSTHLAKASGAQSKQIGAASESIAAMAASTEEVSGNAERSADVARHSVDIAHKGGDAVRRTIDGMNAIRENIQETSKRIKRLGESSQEIGNIVELINDIAEQTNILALNASIQASMAGEAGRGFAVVADEVQRLAERAANATKQIEVLVRTIQADTNEAVVSMERTTTDVVGGALLAENAGAALEEIEQVSNQIASLVQNISASARQQATSSQSISRNMQVLREISSQTAESTTATSTSIGKLAELAAQLRKSVTGFRLPGGAVSVTGEYPVLRPEDVAAAEAADRPRRVSGLPG